MLQTGICYHIILNHPNEKKWFVSKIFLPLIALFHSSGYFPIAAHEPEVSHIHNKKVYFSIEK